MHTQTHTDQAHTHASPSYAAEPESELRPGWVPSPLSARSQHVFSVMGWLGIVLGFAGQTVSAATTQLCQRGSKTVTDSVE